MTATSLPPAHARPATAPSRLVVIATGAGLLALSGPGQTAGFSVFVDPVTDAYDVSRSQLTAVYLVATLLAAPVGMWLGQQLDRRRLVTMIRIVGGGLALALAVTASSPVLLVLAIGIFGLRAFGQSGLSLAATVFVARAITERRGAALGWLSALGGFAISLTPLIASRLIPAIGWRETWFLLAVVVFGASYGLASATSRGDRARVVAAVAEPVADDAGPTPIAVAATPELELGDPDPRRRRWGFVVVASGFATVAGIGTALAFHQVAVLGERGLSTAEAATNFLPQSIAAASCAVVVGRVVDRIPGRVVVPGVMTLLVAALASLRFVSSPITAVLFGLVMGAAGAANAASEGALLARWTGTASLGRLRGRMMMVVVVSTAVAPLLFTLLADAVGSFTRAATVVMLLPVAVATMALLAPVPIESARRRDRPGEVVRSSR